MNVLDTVMATTKKGMALPDWSLEDHPLYYTRGTAAWRFAAVSIILITRTGITVRYIDTYTNISRIYVYHLYTYLEFHTTRLLNLMSPWVRKNRIAFLLPI